MMQNFNNFCYSNKFQNKRIDPLYPSNLKIIVASRYLHALHQQLGSNVIGLKLRSKMEIYHQPGEADSLVCVEKAEFEMEAYSYSMEN